MSQTRGRAVLDYSNLFSSDGAGLLDKVLQGADQIDIARTPAINKENNSTQGSRVGNELPGWGMSSPDASVSHVAPAIERSRGAGQANLTVGDDGMGAVSTPAHASTGVAPVAGVFSRSGDTSADPSGAFGGFGAAAEDYISPGLSNDNDARHKDWHARSVSPWSYVHREVTFTSDREPEGSVIPRGAALRKNYADGQYTEVRFLEDYDMCLGQAEGEGGVAVVENVLRFVKLETPTSVDTGDKLLVPMELTFRATAFERFLADDRSVVCACVLGICVCAYVCIHACVHTIVSDFIKHRSARRRTRIAISS